MVSAPRLPKWALVCALAAGLVGVLGVVTLGLFYAVEAPHIHGTHRWGSDPNEVLGYANDASGVIWFAFLVPLALAFRTALKPRGEAISLAGIATMVVGIVAGLGLMTGLLSVEIEGAISGLASLVVAGWLALVARRGSAQGLLPKTIGVAVQLIVVVLIASLALAALSLVLPRSKATNLLTAVLAAPGVLAYVAIPIWLCWTGSLLLRARRAG